MEAVSLMFRFLASLAASAGTCDLDSANHVHLPQTLDVLLGFCKDTGKE